MTLENILKWAVMIGLFALLFTPLVVATSFFFPFITGKAFFFRIVVEIIFGLWIILALINPSYRPKRSPILWAVAFFVAIITLATVFGVDPAKSLWSNYERMEGLITYFHLLAYFLVASSVLSVTNLWHRFIQTSVGASILVAGYSYLQLFGLVTINQGGVRLDSTFGNATYLAIYVVFHLFFLAWLFVTTNIRWQKVTYTIIGILELVILYYTATRGAILGLIAGIVITAAIIALKGSGRSKKVAVGVIAAIIVLAGIFVAIRNVPAVRENPVLGRFASISLTERTTQSRFIIWQMGLEGFKERPILGWGPENYIQVFNKYYDPQLWRQEQWFDRSHNAIFDWLIAGGLLGLLAYLLLFIIALRAIYRSNRPIIEKSIFVGLLVAYFCHNLFVFDNIGSYLMFYSVLAFLAGSFMSADAKLIGGSKKLSDGWNAVVGIAVAILIITGVFGLNTNPILANKELIKGLIPEPAKTQEEAVAIVNDRVAHFEQSINYGTFGVGEAREQLANWTMQMISSPLVPNDLKQRLAAYAFSQLDEQAKANPNDARSQLYVGLFLRAAGRGDLAIDYFNKAHKLSPSKQTILMEIAKTEAGQGKLVEAINTAKSSLDLDPNFPEARKLYASLLIYNHDISAADKVLLEGFGTTTIYDQGIVNALADTGLYRRVLNAWYYQTMIDPTNVQNWISLAAAYYSIGEVSNSIKAIEKAVEINPNFASEANYYLTELRAGRRP